jgi:hypothetical protein
MRKTFTVIGLALIVLLSACTRGRMLPPRTVEVEGSYSIAIPANLKPCNDLHDFASLQFADERGGYFLVGIQEPKSKMEQLEVQYTLSDYADFVETTVGGAFDTVVVHQRDTLLINGIHCQTVDFNAAVMSDESPLEVYYHLAVFEAEDQFYQLIGWSERDRQSAFRDAVLAMEQSFQVCGNPSGQFQTASAAKLR